MAESNPIGGEIGHEVDSIRYFLVSHDAALGWLVPVRAGLERNGARGDAAVEFGKHNVHGQVAGAQTLRVTPPIFLRGPGKNDLQDRAVMDDQRIGVSA